MKSKERDRNLPFTLSLPDGHNNYGRARAKAGNLELNKDLSCGNNPIIRAITAASHVLHWQDSLQYET